MAVENQPKPEGANPRSCFLCGTPSDKRVLIPCLTQGQERWVCVRCLPMVIHSSE